MSPNLFDQGEPLQTFLLRQAQLCGLGIGKSQPAQNADHLLGVSYLQDLLFRRKQPYDQGSTFPQEHSGQPEGEGEQDHITTHLCVWR